MLIPAVEASLERLLRATLPLPAEHGDVSYETPASTWAASVGRLTLNLFLYSLSRSPQPPRAQPRQLTDDGTRVRRHALPMVELRYLVSAWAGSPRDEHELLGDALTRLLIHQVLPPEHVAESLSSNIQLAVDADMENRPRELWAGLGGQMRASFTLSVTVAADAYAWEDEEPLADRVVPQVDRLPGPELTS